MKEKMDLTNKEGLEKIRILSFVIKKGSLYLCKCVFFREVGES